MFCNNCGNQIDDNATFCPHCGQKIEPQQIEVPRVNTSVGSRVARNQKKNTKSPMIFIVLGIVVCLVLAGGVGFLVINSNKVGSTPTEVIVKNDKYEAKLAQKGTKKKSSNESSTSNDTQSTNQSVQQNTDGYILKDSDKVVLTENDLSGLNANQLRLARNEIYARHGRKFKDEELQSYFDKCTWYHGTIEPDDFNDESLNAVEKQNKDIITNYETKMGYR